MILPKSLHVEKIESPEGLVGLKCDWRRLEASSRLPFESWDWAIAWWTHFREDQIGLKDSLFVRAFRTDEGELVGIAPLILTRRPSIGPVCVRQVHFFGADPNITELRGVVSHPEHRQAVYQSLVAHLEDCSDDWDWAILSGLSADWRHSALSVHSRAKAEWVRDIADYELPLPGTWEEFAGRLPRNMKESLRKCRNSLKRDGLSSTLEVVRTRAEVAPALERFFELHAARAACSSIPRHADVFGAPASRAFLIDVCSRFADQGTLRIFILHVGNQAVAIRIGFLVGGSLYLYYSGYDPEFARYSVMTTLVAEAIRYAIAKHLDSVNLSTGSDVSKLRWNPVEALTSETRLVSPATRSEIVHQICRIAIEGAGRLGALSMAAHFLGRRSKLWGGAASGLPYSRGW